MSIPRIKTYYPFFKNYSSANCLRFGQVNLGNLSCSHPDLSFLLLSRDWIHRIRERMILFASLYIAGPKKKIKIGLLHMYTILYHIYIRFVVEWCHILSVLTISKSQEEWERWNVNEVISSLSYYLRLIDEVSAGYQ